MSTPILATKLYIPPPRPEVVLRHRLIERLNDSLQRQLTFISAPTGFGKTTLISSWINQKHEGGTLRVKDESRATLEDNGDTLLTGPVVDQAALFGLLKKDCIFMLSSPKFWEHSFAPIRRDICHDWFSFDYRVGISLVAFD